MTPNQNVTGAPDAAQVARRSRRCTHRMLAAATARSGGVERGQPRDTRQLVGVGERERASKARRRTTAGASAALRETPMGMDPRIVVRHDNLASNSSLASRSEAARRRLSEECDARADHLSATDAGPCAAAARRAGAARKGLRHLADAHLVRSSRTLVRAAGVRPGRGRAEARRASRGRSARTGRGCTHRCWPRSRWARFRCRCTRTRWPASSSSRSTTPRSRFAIVEDQEQVDKLLELRRAVPAARAHLVRRPARPAPLRRARPGVARRLVDAGRAYDARARRLLRRRGRSAAPHDVAAMFFTSGTTGNAEGRGAHALHAARPRQRRQGASTSSPTNEEVLAYLPPAWIGQNIFSYAQWLACGYVVNCPGVGRAR